MNFSHSLKRFLGIFLVVGVLASLGFAGQAPKISAQKKAAATNRLDRTKQVFVENKGQWDPRALFLARTGSLDTWVTNTGITYDYHRPAKHGGKVITEGQVVQLQFVGESHQANTVGTNPANYIEKYIPRKGGKIAVAKTYKDVISHDVFAGVEMRNYFDGSNPRYDFVVDPKANPSLIQFKLKGATNVVANHGNLSFSTQLGTMSHGKLFAYQWINNQKIQVLADFEVAKSGQVSFKLGKYDSSKELVIDPVVYGTYFGGSDNWSDVRAIVADTTGGVYLTGSTACTTFPVTTGPYFISLKGVQNAYVSKLQGDAYNVDYSVYFGGSNIDYGQFIQIDPFGNVWIAGVTTSPDFPGNTKASSPSNPDIFVIRFEKSATEVLDPVTHPATLMVGGPGAEVINGFQIVPVNNPTQGSPVTLLLDGSSNQATPEVLQGSFSNSVPSGFILRYSFDGTTFTPVSNACEYVGNEGGAAALPVFMSGLAVDAAGNAYVTGVVGDGVTNVDTSVSPGFITTAGVFTGGRLVQKTDLFARKYDTTGNIVYSAVVGGSGVEYPGGIDDDETGTPYTTGSCIAVDSNNNAYICGISTSFDYPRTRGVFGEIFNGLPLVVVTKINNDASQILYSTNLNTFGPVSPAGIAVDSTGQAYVTGLCDAPNDVIRGNLTYTLQWAFPPPTVDVPTGYGPPPTIQVGSSTSDTPPDPNFTTTTIPQLPTSEGFLTVIDPTASTLVMGTYLGGLLDEHLFGPYVDSLNDVWVNGSTSALRVYYPPGGTTPFVQQNQTLPTTLITTKAFKSTDANDAGIYVPAVIYDLQNGISPIPFGNPFGSPGESRDGFLVKMRIGQPIITAVTVTPVTIPGGLGESALVNVTLSSAAPVGGAAINLSLNSTVAASFSASSALNAITVTIPAGQTTFTAGVPVYSSPVTQTTQVLIEANYEGSFVIAPLNVIPWLQSLVVAPNATVGGNAVTGTITLAQPAPAGGVTINLSVGSGLLSLPGGNTLTIPAGSSSAVFTINTGGVDFKTYPTVTASFLGVVDTTQVELDAAAMATLILTPNETAGGSSVVGTVTLNGLPGPNFPGVQLSIQGNPGGYVINPTTLTGADFNGTPQATFTIQTPPVNSQQTVVVQAKINAQNGLDYVNQTLTANLIVDYIPLVSFQVSPSVANPGDTLTGTLTLGKQADPSGVQVNLASNDPIYISLPSSVTIPGGETAFSFPIQVNNVAVVMPTVVGLSANIGGLDTQYASVALSLSTLTLSLTPPATLGGNSVTGTVTLSSPAPNDLPVTITISPQGVGTLVGSVVIPAGQTEATFTINTVGVANTTQLTVTAQIYSLKATAEVTINSVQAQSIVFLPSVARGGTTVQCRIVLNGNAPAGGTVVTLTSSNPNVASIPAEVVVPAGQSTYLFSVFTHRVSRSLTTQVTATAGGVTTNPANLTVQR